MDQITIAAFYDKLNDEEKDFFAYLSLQHLIEQYKNELNQINGKDIKDVVYMTYLKDALKELNLAKEALTYRIF